MYYQQLSLIVLYVLLLASDVNPFIYQSAIKYIQFYDQYYEGFHEYALLINEGSSNSNPDQVVL